MKSLKEWAVVVKALENGDQTIILRKGGILEAASGFLVESKRFFLFPTHEHQKLDSIKPQYRKYLDNGSAGNSSHSSGIITKTSTKMDHNQITSYAEVIGDVDIFSEEKINALSPFHIWSDSYIRERVGWMPEKPLKALFLKVFKVPEFEVPIRPEHQGCKSWIDINEDVSSSGELALSDEIFDSRFKSFEEIVN